MNTPTSYGSEDSDPLTIVPHNFETNANSISIKKGFIKKGPRIPFEHDCPQLVEEIISDPSPMVTDPNNSPKYFTTHA